MTSLGDQAEDVFYLQGRKKNSVASWDHATFNLLEFTVHFENDYTVMTRQQFSTS